MQVWKVGGRKVREVFSSFFFGDDAGEMVAIDDLLYPANHFALSGRDVTLALDFITI